MAHELTHARGKWEFAYVGESPWHQLGQRLPSVATRTEIMHAAGLEWSVLPEPIFLGNGERIPGFVANVRGDTRETLGIVSTEYRAVQNTDAFLFLDSLVSKASAMYHTAGSIRRGRKVFATAKLPQSIAVTPQDVVDQYLLLVNGHDGTSGLHLQFTPIRVVCANTLAAALGRSSRYQYSVRHVGDLEGHLREARVALGVAARHFEVAGKVYRALSAKMITEGMLETFLHGFVPVPVVDAASTEGAIRAREQALEIHERVRALFEGGIGTELPGVRGTAWGAVNAAIEWIERVRPARQDGMIRKGGAEAAILGAGQDFRQRAFDSALALLS